ncbi:sulfite exporter TauE/SafE family protein [Bacteriovorax sp. Seq25_V]|uniref:sulfite exporter TauE/SafE family protein n=1 Tax=Bacteriovorax sp. Seq25_V TaxID=1201288 RepID=UPI000389E473|nr:sulfite exporter TauE/SafE family protein [Bacteriovorax sp. Seq25_V]EQC45730.1 sulfite exporter TauE/SafE [Bacteriovorax sp. Seq25_V]
MTFLIYIGLGIFAGTLSGIFGIGGGLVIVPTLLFCFKILNFPEEYAMHMAVGTSLSIILVTVANSMYGHHKNSNVDWSIVKKIFISIVIGAFVGSFVSKDLAADTLEVIFSIYVVVVSLKMFSDIKVERELKPTSMTLYSVVGFIIGFKSALLGIGGGTISIPFLTWRGQPMKKAVGVSAALGIPIALSGSASYILNGYGNPNLPEYSLGYVYLPALVGVVLTSSYFARVGAKISHRLPQAQMKKGFAIFLMIVAIKMIYQNLHG